MILICRRKHLLAIVGLVALSAAGLLLAAGTKAVPAFSSQTPQGEIVIIDAGHGGEDGGAVSADGVAESHINLSIAKRVENILLFLGQETMMTRTGEEAVYSSDATTLREKKASDLKNRVAMVNEQEHAVLLSIHQNSLPSHPSVHGAQVFYNTVEPGQAMAESVQQVLNQIVNNGNEKATKPIDSSVYLMKNSQAPSILVECGFMSNANEVRLLQNQDYQLRLAACIVAGLRQYHVNEG